MDGGDPAGGSAELARLIDQTGESIFADLQRYYGVRVLDVLVDGSGLSPRQVLAYIRQLPPESATVAALRGGDQFRGWDTSAYMLANLFDAIQANTYAFISANSKRKPKAPEPFERPDIKVAKKKKPSLFAAMARAQYQKNRKAKDGGP